MALFFHSVIAVYIIFISMGNTHSTYNMLRFSQQCLIHNKSQAAYVAFLGLAKTIETDTFSHHQPIKEWGTEVKMQEILQERQSL